MTFHLTPQDLAACLAIAFLTGWSAALLLVLLGIPRRVECWVAGVALRRMHDGRRR
jgi:hypothetical protein